MKKGTQGKEEGISIYEPQLYTSGFAFGGHARYPEQTIHKKKV